MTLLAEREPRLLPNVLRRGDRFLHPPLRAAMSSASSITTIANWRSRESGTLRGLFTAHLPSGLTLHELMLHHRDGSWWVSFPSKPMVGTDGVALRDERGKVRYGAPLIEFTSPQARNRFIEQVLAALRQAQPQVFVAEAVG